jgi:hypothetical protein
MEKGATSAYKPRPRYHEKVELLLNTLRCLGENEMFFFLDEWGPIQVRRRDRVRDRKRSPVAPATISNWESALDNWVNPNLGDLPLDTVNNQAMKELVAKLIASGELGPKSISNYTQVVKMVVASVSMNRVNRFTHASGIKREIDLHPTVAAMLKDYIGDRASGLLFCSRTGKQLWQSNILRRGLHPALKKIGWRDEQLGIEKSGSHALRRFRNTYCETTPPRQKESINSGWGTLEKTRPTSTT